MAGHDIPFQATNIETYGDIFLFQSHLLDDDGQ